MKIVETSARLADAGMIGMMILIFYHCLINVFGELVFFFFLFKAFIVFNGIAVKS